jgi:hemolysin-activating ACP:hemolysin acyltransferase
MIEAHSARAPLADRNRHAGSGHGYPSLPRIIALWLRDPMSAGLSIEQLVDRIGAALASGRAHLFVDGCGDAVGYAASIAADCDTHRALFAGHVPDVRDGLHRRRGDHLWFIDVVCPGLDRRAYVAALKPHFGAHEEAFALLPDTASAALRPVRAW